MKTLNIGIIIEQGTDFSLVIGVYQPSALGPLPVDLTGYQFRGQVKENSNADSEVIAEFDFAVSNQTTNRGQVVMSLTNEITSMIPTTVISGEQPNRLRTPYVFDVKMLDTSSKITRPLQGVIEMSPEVTAEEFT